MTRPLRFGMVFTDNATGAGFTDLARRMEDDGFSTLLVADHLTNDMACGPLLVAAAAATTRLRVGSFVYDNDFRHPAVLAKEAATIDVLTGGRLELGIGAGWDRQEYDLAGIPFDPPRVRVDRMVEALGIIERLLAGEAVHHDGPFYSLAGLEGLPTPVQAHIPILLGGGGPRMMRLAVERADIVGLVPQSLRGGGLDWSTGTEDAFDARMAALDEAIAAGGREDGGPERNVLVFDLWRSIAEAEAAGADPVVAATSPYVLAGDTEAMVDAIQERRDRWGLSYFVCFVSDRNADLFRALVRRLAS